jgi:hypothetical protein
MTQRSDKTRWMTVNPMILIDEPFMYNKSLPQTDNIIAKLFSARVSLLKLQGVCLVQSPFFKIY